MVVQAAGQDYPFQFESPFLVRTSKPAPINPYDEGLALCRLERSTRPEHTGRRTIVMRLLKILIPPKLISNPPPHFDTTLPAEGELFMKSGRIWYRDLDRDTQVARALRPLYDIDDAQAPGQP